METFTRPRPPVDNPEFAQRKERAESALDLGIIDPPLIEIVTALNRLPYCFTLQSCYGHFFYGGRTDPRTIEPLPACRDRGPVQYRIAYVALCVEKSGRGHALLGKLERLTEADPQYIQFGCAEWFRERHVNSYVVQVEPERFMDLDSITVSYDEALRIQRARDAFFVTVHRDSDKPLISRWGRLGGEMSLPLHPHRAQSRLKPGEPLPFFEGLRTILSTLP